MTGPRAGQSSVWICTDPREKEGSTLQPNLGCFIGRLKEVKATMIHVWSSFDLLNSPCLLVYLAYGPSSYAVSRILDWAECWKNRGKKEKNKNFMRGLEGNCLFKTMVSARSLMSFQRSRQRLIIWYITFAVSHGGRTWGSMIARIWREQRLLLGLASVISLIWNDHAGLGFALMCGVLRRCVNVYSCGL